MSRLGKRPVSVAPEPPGKRFMESSMKSTARVNALRDEYACLARQCKEANIDIDSIGPWDDGEKPLLPDHLQQNLTRRICERWFAHAYDFPSDAHTYISVQRSTLQAQLNNALGLFNLDPIRRTDAMWTWFLADVVHIPQSQLTNGRNIMLCDRRSQRGFLETCTDLLQEAQRPVEQKDAI